MSDELENAQVAHSVTPADDCLTRKVPRLVRFGAVGVAATVFDFALLFAFSRAGLPDLAANTLSFSASTALNYLLSRRFVYPDGTRGGFPAFAAGSVVGLLVNDAVVWLLAAPAGLLAAKAAATAASTAWNWFSRLKIFGIR